MSHTVTEDGRGREAASVVIERVTVLPMTQSGRPQPEMTVVLDQGRIAQIMPAETAQIPSGAQRISGQGKWLMPGLTDMHVHIENPRLLREVLNQWRPDHAMPAFDLKEQAIFTPYVQNGVLQVFNLSAMSETFGQRDAIERGRIIGPHLAVAAMMDGPAPFWPVGMTRMVETADGATQAVRDAEAEGYGFIKTYSGLSLPVFTALVQEAKAQGMKVVGHLPGRGENNTAAYLQPGFGLVAHAEEYYHQQTAPTDDDIDRFAALALENGTWLVATLITDERILEQLQTPDLIEHLEGFDQLSPVVRTLWTRANPYLSAASGAFCVFRPMRHPIPA